MKISIILKTTLFMGDHCTEVSIAHELKAGETVEELVSRLILPDSDFHLFKTDSIELRKIVEAPNIGNDIDKIVEKQIEWIKDQCQYPTEHPIETGYIKISIDGFKHCLRSACEEAREGMTDGK